MINSDSQYPPLKISDRPRNLQNGQEADMHFAMTVETAPTDFLWQGGLMVGSVGTIHAPGGVGKSFFSLELCMSISSGLDFLGLGIDVMTQ